MNKILRNALLVVAFFVLLLVIIFANELRLFVYATWISGGSNIAPYFYALF